MPQPLIIDSHAHVFPDPLEKFAPNLAHGPVAAWRRRTRSWMRPFTTSLHKTQTFLRLLPESARRKVDELQGFAPLPSLLVESTVADLRDVIEDAGIHASIVIAHPALISNEFILEVCAEDPRMIPVVNIARDAERPAAVFKKYVKQGARALKIHPAADGEGASSPRYKALIRAATDLGLPVIVHTGCVHTHLFYKDPDQGRAQNLAPWFKAFPETRFVLAHMNFHEPEIAFDLAEDNPNIYMDTSWQPVEIIGEAVRRVGAERILFGTDWPFGGNNLRVGLKRMRDAADTGLITDEERNIILGENARKLFDLDVPSILGTKPLETATHAD